MVSAANGLHPMTRVLCSSDWIRVLQSAHACSQSEDKCNVCLRGYHLLASAGREPHVGCKACLDSGGIRYERALTLDILSVVNKKYE